jgi:hypothetical protein
MGDNSKTLKSNAAEAYLDEPVVRERQLRIDQKFALFPINNDSSSRRVRLVKNGRLLRSFTASLGSPAHWWAHLDVSAWQGQTLTLSVEPDNSPSPWPNIPGRGASETDNAELVEAIRTSAEIWSPETLYKLGTCGERRSRSLEGIAGRALPVRG